jgi:hypothetical protein
MRTKAALESTRLPTWIHAVSQFCVFYDVIDASWEFTTATHHQLHAAYSNKVLLASWEGAQHPAHPPDVYS